MLELRCVDREGRVIRSASGGDPHRFYAECCESGGARVELASESGSMNLFVCRGREGVYRGSLVIGKGMLVEALGSDCIALSADISKVIELVKRVESETLRGLSYLDSGFFERLRRMFELLLPDHVDEGIAIHLAMCRSTQHPILAVEVPHFEHCSTTDILSIARVMQELETFIGSTYLEALLCTDEYVAIVTYIDCEEAALEAAKILLYAMEKGVDVGKAEKGS